MAQPVRGTQTVVEQMAWVFRRPSLVAIEIAWRWIFGVPLLVVCWMQAQNILAKVPPDSTGLASLDTQNPWVAVVQLADVWAHYEPHIAAALTWLVPLAAVAWIVVSGAGRGILLKHLEPGLGFRPIPAIFLQGAWLVLLGVILAGWFRGIQWVAASHISSGGEADLVGYSIWAIFLSLGVFTLWALVSWPFAIAPLLLLLEDRSAFSALAESFRLGRTFTSKLMEINLVMGIVKLALIVLAMVFSAAPLPFSDQLGSAAMHLVWFGATAFFLIANDYFHVVKLKGFLEFWRTYRGANSIGET